MKRVVNLTLATWLGLELGLTVRETVWRGGAWGAPGCLGRLWAAPDLVSLQAEPSVRITQPRPRAHTSLGAPAPSLWVCDSGSLSQRHLLDGHFRLWVFSAADPS